MASMQTDQCPDDDNQSSTSPHFVPEDIGVKVAGTFYDKISKCGCGDRSLIIISQYHVPDDVHSLKQLSEKLRDRLSMFTPENEEICKEEENVGRSASKHPEVSFSYPKTWKNLFTSFDLSGHRKSESSAACSVDEVMENVIKGSGEDKKVLIETMRHIYKQCSLPGHGTLARCSCRSCWNENLLNITRGSVTPTHPYPSCPLRNADKCEKIRSVNRVRFSDKQKLLTFDAGSGDVFHYEEGPPDLSGVHKEVGVITHDLEDSDEETDEYDSSEEEYDSDESEEDGEREEPNEE